MFSRENEMHDEESLKRLVKEAQDPFWVHYVGMLNPPRVGVTEFAHTLEHKYFTPDTKKNNYFHCNVLMWKDIMWAVVSIPLSLNNLAEEIINQVNLRAADGVPTVFGMGPATGIASMREKIEETCEFFPLNGGNVFHLEYKKKHAAYDNSQVGIKQMLEEEKERLDEVPLRYGPTEGEA